jgi:endoglucanase
LLRIISFLLLLIPANTFGQAHWNNTSFVHRQGDLIKDGGGNTIRLEGVNLGGWLLWEAWIWGGGFTQEKTMYERIENKIGAVEAANFQNNVYWNYITEEDIELIGDECFNIVRIPFNHTILEDDANPFVYKDSGWKILDSVLSWCEQNNVYALLDLHSAPGGQSNSFTADTDTDNLWEDPINQTRTVALWKAIANRYKNRGIVAGYDLLNEPNAPDAGDLVLLYERIADSIRTVDNNHMLFIEGNNFASDFSMFTSAIDPNMLYEFHFYTWFMGADFTPELQAYTDLSTSSGIPVWCGEWGETNVTHLETVLTLFRDDVYNIRGSALWTWKKVKKAGQEPFYNGVDSTANWNKSIQWISNIFAPSPTVAEMQNGIISFLQNSDLTYCTFNNTLNNFARACGWLTSADITSISGNVYPNPFYDHLNFSGFPDDRALEFQLFDASGKLIQTSLIRGNSVVHFQQNLLAPGLYFYKISDQGNLLSSGKLIAP